MANKNFGSHHSTADDRLNKERNHRIHNKNGERSKLSDATAEKIAKVLHIMLNEK